MSHTIPDNGSKFYRDDWGTIYLTEWTSNIVKGVKIYDFTSVIKQPYVWNEVEQGYIKNRHVFRKGIVTYKRSIIEETEVGYVIRSEGYEQKVEYFDTTFSCHPVPNDDFDHHLNEIVSDECTTTISEGFSWCEPDGETLWSDLVWIDVFGPPTINIFSFSNGSFPKFSNGKGINISG